MSSFMTMTGLLMLVVPVVAAIALTVLRRRMIATPARSTHMLSAKQLRRNHQQH